MAEPALDDNLLDVELIPTHRGAAHPLFDLWRETDPVHWNPVNPDYVSGGMSPVSRGFWVLTRHQDVFDVSRDQEKFTSWEHGFTVWDAEGEELARMQANFMGMRPEAHAAVKQVIVPPFSPKAMLDLEPVIVDAAREIIDEVCERGECEFVFDVASKLPVYSFCELMGIPVEDRQTVVDCGNAMADIETIRDLDYDPYERLFGICARLTEEKRRVPDGRLLSAMANNEALDLDQMQINNFFMVFAIAGHETTRSTAAHFVNLMHRHPEQYELLCSDVDAHLENAIEEVLRYTSTTTNFCRFAAEDCEVGGQPIKQGEKIFLSYAAANRDPAVFEDPHRFDITRKNARKHLAFGTGPHVCVGARLARMQLKHLLREMITRLPDLKPSAEPTWLKSIWFNAIVDMPVTFTPSATSSAS